MKNRLSLHLLATLVALLACNAGAAEFDFYERFASLIQTNRFGPPLTNSTLSLDNLRRTGEIAGIKLGTRMSTAVELWGKPRNFYASCGGGPFLMFGHGTLHFRGEKVVRISLFPNTIPGLRFESGLTATNTAAQFAKALGLAVPGAAQWQLSVPSEAGIMHLDWTHFAAGGWQLSSVTFESPALREPANR